MASNQKEKNKKDDDKILGAGLFGPKILLKYDKPIKHNSEYLPDGHLCFNIIGASGCGKSHILLSLIPQIANLAQIAICSLITNNPVYKAIGSYCESHKPDPIEFQILTDPQNAQATIETLIENKPEDKQGLIIFDDFSQQKSGRNDPYNQCAASVSALLRNYGYYSAFITQSATNIPTLFRNNANVRICFRMNDQHAIRSIKGDFCASGILRPNEFDGLYKQLARVDHSFLMLISKGGKNDRLYIYLPETPDARVQEVEIQRMPDLREDSTLVRMIEQIRTWDHSNETAGNSFSRMTKRRMREHLRNYVAYLANQYQQSKNDIEDELEKTFKISL